MKDLLNKPASFTTYSQQINSAIIGLVTNIVDLYGNRLIQIRCFDLGNNYEIWGRICLCIDIPQIGDKVLVTFINGQIEFPYVIGKVETPQFSKSKVRNIIRDLWHFIWNRNRSGA
ncbi:hypothetical protein WA1_25550 [Scytonema hofmannii PCC 7110]|uniref:Uncharacterized protein n=1 Tax=Scytonema hofmannii PCC 7110 TaxID=128403 RepID=A0A139X711_9CYAN|nr:hypothetical protein [Scytonema hofmannii]KYC40491.1 hypothetical protein WA1_25550 [Scytonema hofmannii PCC 7110]